MRGAAASSLFADAQNMLDDMISQKWLTARAVIGFWPAARDGDDILCMKMKAAQKNERGSTLFASKCNTAAGGRILLADFIARQAAG